MRNEKVINEALKLKTVISEELNTTDDKREKYDLSGALKVLDSMLYRLGYKAPRKSAVVEQPANIYKAVEVKAKEDKPKYNNNPPDNIYKAEIVEEKEEPTKGAFPKSPFIVSEEQHNANEKKKPKKVRTTPEDKEAIKMLVDEGKTVAEMSEKLHIEEATIRKVLGMDNQAPKKILATNTSKNNK
jgi:hypothetical protein